MRGYDRSKTSPTLLRRLRNPNDAEAWSEFLDRYGPKIYRWCLQHRAQVPDAEDTTQNVLLRLFKCMARFDYDPEKGKFRGWLKTITNRAWIDYRNECDRAGQLSEWTDDISGESLAETLSDTFDMEILEEAESRVRLLISDRDWQILVRRMHDGVSGAIAAKEFEMTVAAVHMVTKRVKDLLKKEVRRLRDDDSDSQESLP